MRFIKSAGTTLAFKIIAMSFGLGISVLIGRAMGPEGRGVYGLVMTVIMISSVFGVFGLGAANVVMEVRHARQRVPCPLAPFSAPYLKSSLWVCQ